MIITVDMSESAVESQSSDRIMISKIIQFMLMVNVFKRLRFSWQGVSLSIYIVTTGGFSKRSILVVTVVRDSRIMQS